MGCARRRRTRANCGRGEIGRRSRLQLECPRGNPWSRTAQSRGKLRVLTKPIPSQAPLGEGVETRRAAPTVGRLWRRDSPDHERQCGGGESRGGTKICFSKGNAGSSPAVRTILFSASGGAAADVVSNRGHTTTETDIR